MSARLRRVRPLLEMDAWGRLRRSCFSAPGLLACPLPSGSKMAKRKVLLCKLSYLICIDGVSLCSDRICVRKAYTVVQLGDLDRQQKT